MKKKAFPDRITIELTNRCNASCTFCHRQEVAMKIGDMKPELYYRIIDEAARHLPVTVVLFFRGEPLLCPELPDYIRYAKERGVGPVQLASNGMALTEELALQLCESGLDFMSFSLDTMDAEVYRQSRQAGELQVAIDNVRRMGEICAERKKQRKPAPALQVSTIDMEVYRPTQKEFIEFWKKYVDIVRVYYEHDEKGRLVDAGLREQLEVGQDRKPCRKVFNDMIIYWDGKTALCNYDWDEKNELGDVNCRTVEEIWNSEIYDKIREMHNAGKIEGKLMCKDCQHWMMSYTKEGFFGTVIKSKENDSDTGHEILSD